MRGERRESDGSNRGFAGMSDDQQREIAQKGGEIAAGENQRDEQGGFDGSTSGGEAEGKFGEAFIKHEFDQAIAIQQAMVDAERALAEVRPFPQAKSAIESYLAEDQQFLEQVRTLGEPFDASGEAEAVAASMQELAAETSEKAGQAESEAYEAHAVLVSLKRKQADSAAAMIKIGEATVNAKVREAAQQFFDGQTASGKALADVLAEFAVAIATQEA